MDNERQFGPPTDAALVGASLTRPDLFAQIFQRHFGAIHNYLARRVGTPLADDLAALTFTVAFERRRTFDAGSANARPWLYGIATNLLRNHLRAEQRLLHTIARLPVDELVEEPLDSDRALARIDASFASARIAAVLEQLEPEHRDVLLLFAWAQLSYEEIARTLGIPAGTVASRLARVRAELRSRLTDVADAAAQPSHLRTIEEPE
jgi:RNA polymerase sigma-70 factor (ECF subfamily)